LHEAFGHRAGHEALMTASLRFFCQLVGRPPILGSLAGWTVSTAA
jgi:hypothetical protein